MTVPEFSRRERLDAIGPVERGVSIVAAADECAALATRFGLIAIDRLAAQFRLRADASGVVARGTVSAAVVQACSATGEPLPVDVAEDVALRFVAEAAVDEAEIELSADALDTMFHSGTAIDLGEAAAETLALALDPFPRGPNAAAALRAAGVLSEEEAPGDEGAGPIRALSGLKDLLGRQS